jgi:hypothetical protein
MGVLCVKKSLLRASLTNMEGRVLTSKGGGAMGEIFFPGERSGWTCFPLLGSPGKQ